MGTTLEPIVRGEFTKRTNLEVETISLMLKHPKYDFMLANVDGIVNGDEGKKCIFGAKTASAYKLDQWKDNEKEVINKFIITWKNTSTERLDTKKLKEELPEIYEEYIKKTTMRRFLIK